jgi:hypothetical protein
MVAVVFLFRTVADVKISQEGKRCNYQCDDHGCKGYIVLMITAARCQQKYQVRSDPEEEKAEMEEKEPDNEFHQRFSDKPFLGNPHFQ